MADGPFINLLDAAQITLNGVSSYGRTNLRAVVSDATSKRLENTKIAPKVEGQGQTTPKSITHRGHYSTYCYQVIVYEFLLSSLIIASKMLKFLMIKDQSPMLP